MLIYVIANLLWFIAGLVAGVASFGGNLVAVPFITLITDPEVAILAGCISGTAVFVGLAIFYRNHILYRDTVYLICGAMAGIPAGITFLERAGAKDILLAAAIALSVFLICQFIAGKLGKLASPISRFYAFPFGCASGIMMAAVGMGGPPLVLYALLRKWQKETTLGTVNAASLTLMFFVLPGQYIADLYTSQIMTLGFQGALASIFGILLSIPLVRKINIGLFRKLLLAMLCVSALVLLIRSF